MLSKNLENNWWLMIMLGENYLHLAKTNQYHFTTFVFTWNELEFEFEVRLFWGVQVRLVRPLGQEEKFEMFEVRCQSSANFTNLFELIIGTIFGLKISSHIECYLPVYFSSSKLGYELWKKVKIEDAVFINFLKKFYK